VFRWSILVGGWLPRLAGESRRVGYVGGGIGATQGKCSFTRYKDILAGTSGKEKKAKGKGKRNGCIALVEVS
jgi:hypothetical protein